MGVVVAHQIQMMLNRVAHTQNTPKQKQQFLQLHNQDEVTQGASMDDGLTFSDLSQFSFE